MVDAVYFESQSYYDQEFLAEALDLPAQHISRECKAGNLRFTMKGRQRFFKGEWVKAWLDGEQQEQPADTTDAKSVEQQGSAA